MKRCEKCSSLMPDDAPRCIKCGFEAVPARGAAPAVPPVIRPAVKPPASPVTVVAKQVARPSAGGGTPAARSGRMGRIRASLELARQSWRVLSRDKQLLIFPLLSGIACVLVLASFAGGLIAVGGVSDDKDSTLQWIFLFVYYFANYFVIVFFNAALIACAMKRFRGGEPTLRDGLQTASGCLPQILAWVTLAATVGVLLRFIEERVGMVGKIVVALLGAAWTIATYFVVPVLVVEKLGPIDTVQRSVALMKETWGESLVSNVGIGLASTVAVVLILVVGVPAVVALWLQSESFAVLAAGALALVCAVGLTILVSSALHAIVLSALYLYAAENQVPQAFEGAAREAFAAR